MWEEIVGIEVILDTKKNSHTSIFIISHTLAYYLNIVF